MPATNSPSKRISQTKRSRVVCSDASHTSRNALSIFSSSFWRCLSYRSNRLHITKLHRRRQVLGQLAIDLDIAYGVYAMPSQRPERL